MKRTNLHYFAALLLLTFFFSSCAGWKKMVDRADEIGMTVNPDPIEMHAEKVEVNIDVSFPQEYFHKKAIVHATPIVKYDNGQELELETKSFQGEKVTENYSVVSYSNGGSFSYTDEFDYQDNMRVASVELRFSGEMKGKPFEFNDDKYDQLIGNGIITTPRLVEPGLAVDNGSADGAAGYARAMIVEPPLPPRADDEFTSKIHYAIQHSNIRSSELQDQDVEKMWSDVEKAIEAGQKYIGYHIFSYASPDGPEQLNKNLASDRSKAAEKYLTSELEDLEIDIEAGETTVQSEQEDWEGFKRLMQQSNIEDKDLILRVVSMEQNLQKREEEIKKISQAYTEVAERILPDLRRSEMTVKFESKAWTDDEILNYAKTDAAKLTDVECLYGATLTDNNSEKKKIYENFIAEHPEDWRGPNNLGVIYLREGNLDEAEKYFEDAREIDENETVLNNLGVIHLSNYFDDREKGELDEAKEMFESAAEKGQSEEINYNLGAISIINGEYQAAVTYYSGIACAFNASLANLLNGDNTAALKKLDCVDNKDVAWVYYLRAVIGARNDNSDMLFSNLRTATSKNSDLKQYAKEDLEFFDYFEDATFKSIVE